MSTSGIYHQVAGWLNSFQNDWDTVRSDGGRFGLNSLAGHAAALRIVGIAYAIFGMAALILLPWMPAPILNFFSGGYSIVLAYDCYQANERIETMGNDPQIMRDMCPRMICDLAIENTLALKWWARMYTRSG